MGIRDHPISAVALAERLCGAADRSIRRECIDHVIVFGECHLRHLLRSYLNYYNETPTHRRLAVVFPSSAGYGAPEWAYLAFVKAYNEYIRLSNPIV